MPRPRNKPEVPIKIFQGADGKWHGFLTVTGPDGRPSVRHREGKTADVVAEKIRDLQALDAARAVPKAGRTKTIDAWAAHWIAYPARIGVKASTWAVREWAVRLYIVPRLGHRGLPPDLAAADVEAMYAELEEEGLSVKSIHHIADTGILMLDKAEVDGEYVGKNPFRMAKRPRLVELKPVPLTIAEAIRLIDVLVTEPDGPHYLLSLLGSRSGEARGATWTALDWETGLLPITATVETRLYQHGCDDPEVCAAPHCRTSPCTLPWEHGCADPVACAEKRCRQNRYPSDPPHWKPHAAGCAAHASGCPRRRPGACRRHRLDHCPPLCEPGCHRHAARCPQRIGGVTIVRAETVYVADDKPRRRGSRRPTKRALRPVTKTAAGTRIMAIPLPFLPVLAALYARQQIAKKLAGIKWEDNDLIICDEFGRPLDRSRFWARWAALLELAGIDHLTLHAARDTLATLLLALGVPERVVMEVMGWTSREMLQRYQHVPREVLIDLAARVATALGMAVAEDYAESIATDLATGVLAIENENRP